MGQCYGKSNLTPENEATAAEGATVGTAIAVAGSADVPLSPLPVKGTPARASPWPSPYPHGGGVTPSPARGTPRRFFRRSFAPPSPAKHIRASLAKRLGHAKTPKEGPIPEEEAAGAVATEQSLDKSFGYGKNFGAKYEIGKEVGRGHFGHTCYAKGKKGELKDQPVAVKIISKAKRLDLDDSGFDLCCLIEHSARFCKWD
ncbi:hypothetical protein LR48_Vigan11g022000 [Vigna angularis]|uniref:Protein kinase domain-containing protein n=1 Tax=Phaseolus angularis TaxID=3914 RepID=A0A0L9VQF9_PHAAN|nr:hypothetical protein LR48_Vigan11g022000 [Vigna angularis]